MSQPGRYAGPSILQMLWQRLDELAEEAYEYSPGPAPPTLTGEIKGVIACVAIMTNPYRPNPKAIRKEAVVRYKERHG